MMRPASKSPLQSMHSFVGPLGKTSMLPVQYFIESWSEGGVMGADKRGGAANSAQEGSHVPPAPDQEVSTRGRAHAAGAVVSEAGAHP